jgi:hypothetical protein
VGLSAWLGLAAIAESGGDRVFPFFIAVAVALAALAGGFLAARRRRAERAAPNSALMLAGFTLFSLAGAVWLVFKRNPAVGPPPPSEAELQTLVGE